MVDSVLNKVNMFEIFIGELCIVIIGVGNNVEVVVLVSEVK